MVRRRRNAQPTARAGVLAVLAALVALVLAACSSSTAPTTGPGTHPGGSGAATTGATGRRTTPPHHRSPTRTVKPPPTHAQLVAAARSAVARLAAHQPDHAISVAAENMATGARFAAGPQSGMWTASAYKLYVLETLLWRAQHNGVTLTDSEASQATTMIENSDNTAGYELFLDAGSNGGLDAAADAFGMRHTVPGNTDPTFTRTGAQDCLILLRNLVTAGPLDAASRSFTLNLMRNVEADQRWGVGVVADRGTTFANKNGWLSVDNTNGPDEDDNGRWIVTSLGIVTVKGQQVLMAVMTQHQPSMAAGVDLVQRLARDIVATVSK
jgi:hypothetical protein